MYEVVKGYKERPAQVKSLWRLSDVKALKVMINALGGGAASQEVSLSREGFESLKGRVSENPPKQPWYAKILCFFQIWFFKKRSISKALDNLVLSAAETQIKKFNEQPEILKHLQEACDTTIVGLQKKSKELALNRQESASALEKLTENKIGILTQKATLDAEIKTITQDLNVLQDSKQKKAAGEVAGRYGFPKKKTAVKATRIKNAAEGAQTRLQKLLSEYEKIQTNLINAESQIDKKIKEIASIDQELAALSSQIETATGIRTQCASWQKDRSSGSTVKNESITTLQDALKNLGVTKPNIPEADSRENTDPASPISAASTAAPAEAGEVSASQPTVAETAIENIKNGTCPELAKAMKALLDKLGVGLVKGWDLKPNGSFTITLSRPAKLWWRLHNPDTPSVYSSKLPTGAVLSLGGDKSPYEVKGSLNKTDSSITFDSNAKVLANALGGVKNASLTKIRWDGKMNRLEMNIKWGLISRPIKQHLPEFLEDLKNGEIPNGAPAQYLKGKKPLKDLTRPVVAANK